MRTSLPSSSRMLLLLTVLIIGSNTSLQGQFYCPVDTCRASCNDYDRLANYAMAATNILEVSVDSVALIEDNGERQFRMYFKVHGVLFGDFSENTFRILFSKPELINAIIKGYNTAYGAPWCGNTYDGIRSMTISDPKTGYFGIEGFRKNGQSIEWVFPGPGIQYDFGDEPELIGGRLNYEAIKRVVLPYSNDRENNKGQTLFSSRDELLYFLIRLP